MTFQAYLDTIREKTGKTADEFVELAREKGLLVDGVKAGPVIEWLDQEYGLGRGHAMALVSVFRGRLEGLPLKLDRIEKQFAGPKSVWQLAYEEPTDRLAPAGTWNSMVTHRVRLFDGAEIDGELKAWLREAYDRA